MLAYNRHVYLFCALATLVLLNFGWDHMTWSTRIVGCSLVIFTIGALYRFNNRERMDK